MWRSHLAIALRQAGRNRLDAAISVAGLGIGLAAAIVIFLFVRDELGWNAWIPGSGDLYGVLARVESPNEPAAMYSDIPDEAFAPLSVTYPEIAALTRYQEATYGVRQGDVDYNETEAAVVDPAFFKVFPLTLTEGDAATALAAPDGAVLTDAAARRYFGSADPLGRLLLIDGEHAVRVTGVMPELPWNTTIRPSMLLSSATGFTRLHQIDGTPAKPGELNFNSQTFVRLRPGADAKALDARLYGFGQRHDVPLPDEEFMQQVVRLVLEPAGRIHLEDLGHSGIEQGGRAPILAAMSGVAAMVVLVAALNLVNLVTARATRRAAEVGVRKACGAGPGDLLRQFMAETLAKTLLAGLLAVALAEIAMPRFNALFERSIPFRYWADPPLAGAILGVVLVTGLMAGVYPALVLSRVRAAGALKGSAAEGGRGRLREAMVVLQFAVTIALAIGTIAIWRQTEFATTAALKFETANMLLIRGKQACGPAVKDAVAALPGVRGAVCSRSAPMADTYSASDAYRQGQPRHDFNRQAVDFGYFELYGIRPVAGRLFDRARADDRDETGDGRSGLAPSATPHSIVVNEEAVRVFGFGSDAAALGQTILVPQAGQLDARAVVVGVVPDTPVRSVRLPIQAAFYSIDDTDFRQLSVRLADGDPRAALAAIDRVWHEAVPALPIRRAFLNERLAAQYRDIARQADVFGAAAALAVVIALLGLFGLSAFAAERRTKEIGVRKAMGARTADVLRLLVWQFVRPVLLANLIAWPLAYLAVERWLSGFAQRIALGPWMFAMAGGAALAIATLTILGHAVRVARAAPVRALRYE